MSPWESRLEDFRAAAPAAFRPPPLPAIAARGRRRRRRAIVVWGSSGMVAAAVAALLMLTMSLAGVTPLPELPPPIADTITDVDWTRAAVVLPPDPNSPCPAGPVRVYPRDSTAYGHIGQTRRDPDDYSTVLFAILPAVVYGDVTGDGQPEAVLPVRCTAFEDGMMPEQGSQLLVVQQQADRSLRGLGFLGVVHAKYPAYRVEDGKVYVKLSYHHASWGSFGYNHLDTGFTQVFRWDGTAFLRIGGRPGNLNYRGQKADSGSPVRLADLMRGSEVACPGGVVRRGPDPATIGAFAFDGAGFGGEEIEDLAVDINQDGDDELIVAVSCAGPGYPASGSVYVFGQGDTMFFPMDVPFANDGSFDLVRMVPTADGRTIELTLRDRATGDEDSHTLTWNGKRFDPHLGTYRLP